MGRKRKLPERFNPAPWYDTDPEEEEDVHTQQFNKRLTQIPAVRVNKPIAILEKTVDSDQSEYPSLPQSSSISSRDVSFSIMSSPAQNILTNQEEEEEVEEEHVRGEYQQHHQHQHLDDQDGVEPELQIPHDDPELHVLHEHEHDDQNAVDAELHELNYSEDIDNTDDSDGSHIHPNYFSMLHTLSKKWLEIELCHNVSNSASDAFWELATSHVYNMFKVKNDAGIKKKTPQFSHLRKKLSARYCLPVRLDFIYKCNSTGRLTKVLDSSKTPTSRFPPSSYTKVLEIGTVKNSDILNLHRTVCPRFSPDNPPVKISLDGVTETKSTLTNLDVYSLKIDKCRNIYPHKIVRPLNKFPVNNIEHFSDFLEDLKDNSCQITDFIGDNPKRAFVRQARNHAGYYACEYCPAKAVICSDNQANQLRKQEYEKQCHEIDKKIQLIQNTPGTSSSKLKDDKKIEHLIDTRKALDAKFKANNAKKKKHLVWPSSTADVPLRTLEQIEEIVEKIKQKEDGVNISLSKDELQGFYGASLLLDFPDFEFIKGISAEYLHSVCLGVVKRMLELTFNVGEKRNRATTRQLTSPSSYNVLMKNIKVPREFSRRSRNMDFSVLKGQEMRNIILFFFPIIVQCIEVEAKERRLWLMFAFMIRSCIIPDNEFNNVLPSVISNTCNSFYQLYEQLFTPSNCTYNTHVVSSHLLQIRSRGPLTLTSAFPFESFYSELRHSFTPGTVSPLKQILQKVMLRRALSRHCCQNSMFLHQKDTALECNSLIYCYNDKTYTIYKIVSIDPDVPNVLECHIQGRYHVTFLETPNLDWSAIGVFKQGVLSDDTVQVDRSSVSGKS